MVVDLNGAIASAADNKFARILHRGNIMRNWRTFSDIGVTGFRSGNAIQNPLSFDKFKAWSNRLDNTFDLTGWAGQNDASIGADLRTITVADGGSSAAQEATSPTFSVTAAEWVAGALIRTSTANFAQIGLSDGTSVHRAIFRLRNLPGVTNESTGATGTITALGNDMYFIQVWATAVAGTGALSIGPSASGSTITFQGDADAIEVLAVGAHPSEFQIDFDMGDSGAAPDINCFAMAAHNFGHSAGRIIISHDSDQNGAYTQVADMVCGESDHSEGRQNDAVMIFFDAVSSTRWRAQFSRVTLPEIGVMAFGEALTMQRGFYAGFQPSWGRRNTVVRGNKSEGGDWLGRSKVRLSRSVRPEWRNLSDTWCRANLDGANGLVQAVETEPFFMAWRPGEFNDCDYCWTSGSITGPVNGRTAAMSDFAFEAEVLGDD